MCDNKLENENIMVTVCCITYNQEKYIRQALDGFVMQKTNFRYQVIVHDDASTDDTPNIMREYEKKYPDLFIMIYQKENQYSKIDKRQKELKIYVDFILPHIKGKYVAFCEGDDYWCNENKLQRQVDIFEKDKDIQMVSHNVRYVNDKDCIIGKTMVNDVFQEGIVGEEVAVRNRWRFHTTARMYRTVEYKNYLLHLPKFSEYSVVSDYPMTLYFINLGKVYYIDKVMSCYRMGADGSWTIKIYNTLKNGDYYKYTEDHIEWIKMLEEFDEYSNYKFHNFVQDYIDGYIYKILVYRKEAYKYFTKQYFKSFMRLSGKRKIKVLVSLINHKWVCKNEVKSEINNLERFCKN